METTRTEKGEARMKAKILGISDEVLACELCGKTPLKRTVILDIDGAIVYYGTTCAAHTLYGKRNRRSCDKIGARARAAALYYRLGGTPNGPWNSPAAKAVWKRFGFSNPNAYLSA